MTIYIIVHPLLNSFILIIFIPQIGLTITVNFNRKYLLIKRNLLFIRTNLEGSSYAAPRFSCFARAASFGISPKKKEKKIFQKFLITAIRRQLKE
jgi:hypothetical protein